MDQISSLITQSAILGHLVSEGVRTVLDCKVWRNFEESTVSALGAEQKCEESGQTDTGSTAMMASSALAMIKEDVTCPLCWELLKDPVSTDCDHTFCRACITLNYVSNRRKGGVGSCPVCQVHYQFRKLTTNRQMAKIVERLKGFKSIPKEDQKVNICAQHGEKLQLFCRKDTMAICWVCERSQEHRGHQTALIEEVDHEYKEKLQAALQKLMENEKRCDEWQDDLQQQRADWENQIQSDIEYIQTEFKGLRDLLDFTESEKLQELRKEKEDVVKRLGESENELVQQKQWVRDLISDMQHQLELSTMEMLQAWLSWNSLCRPGWPPTQKSACFCLPEDANSVVRRYIKAIGKDSPFVWSQTLKLKQPRTIPKKRRRMFQVQDLKVMLQAYQERLMDVRRCWVHMTLHANNHAVIAINKEKRQIQHTSYYKRNLQISETYNLGVLGYPAIQSGKHYWEVDVSGKNAWLLGLNDGLCAQPLLHSINEVKYNSDVKKHGNFQPKCGYWVIGMKNRSVYNASDECSVTHNSSVLALSLPGPPSRVGVFLDREACTLSFYDVSNFGALIYRFYDPSFPVKVYPYFNPMECSEPMTVFEPPSSISVGTQSKE
ncbi:Tripartite motif-containing 30C [Apodemus speciosus]|uniref:Tripartite motif-containing 30C n=1 Tax=Apodemus speciosus TaxID=105296 RepID=A0ABQ0EZI3_APOSI